MSDVFLSATWLLGALVACALIWVIWWAIFGDRRRDLRRCPCCWHDLSGTPGLVCGECGRAGRSERDLRRPRRRWRVAGFALLALVAAASVIRWRSSDASWTAVAPTWLLLAALPWSEGDRGDIFPEIAVRLNSGELDDAQLEALFARCMRGDGDGGPPTAPWAERYGPYLQWWRRPGFGNQSQQDRLAALPAAVTLRAPPIWLTDAPTCLHLQVDDWWPIGTECRVRIRPRLEGAQEISTVRMAGERIRSPFPFVVPAPPAAMEALDVELVIERRQESVADAPGAETPPPRPWITAEERVVRVPIGERRATAEAIVPIDSETMTAALGDAFSTGLNRWATGRRRFGVRFNMAALQGSEFEDVAIGLRVEALEAGVPRRVLHLWWNADPDEQGPIAWSIEHEDAEALDRLRAGSPEWTLRVTGAPEIAVRALGLGPRSLGAGQTTVAPAAPKESPPKFWAGSIESALSVVDRPGEAPPRAWRPE